RAPDIAQAILENIGQAKCEQQAVKRVPPIKAAYHQTLDKQTQHGRQNGSNNQRPPETQVRRQLIRDIGTQCEKAAVREINDTGQIDDEGQSQRHQGIEGADDQSVEHIEKNQLSHSCSNMRNRETTTGQRQS